MTYRVYLSARPRAPETAHREPLGYVDILAECEHTACERAKIQAIAKWWGSYKDLCISKIQFLR